LLRLRIEVALEAAIVVVGVCECVNVEMRVEAVRGMAREDQMGVAREYD
jgi:hypothetical protein